MRLIPATGNRPISASIGDRLARVFLAGDWTATGWPATMEGASAADICGGSPGRFWRVARRQFSCPDLAPGGLMKLF